MLSEQFYRDHGQNTSGTGARNRESCSRGRRGEGVTGMGIFLEPGSDSIGRKKKLERRGAEPVRAQRGCMFSSTGFSRLVAVALAVACDAVPAYADSEFPFGFEMTLETAPQPGTKRMPTLEIGDNGEATLDLWCKGGKGQFSVAGNTVIFVPGQMQDRATCAPGQSEVDDDVLAALGEAATWKRQGDLVTFIGTRSLRFRMNTN